MTELARDEHVASVTHLPTRVQDTPPAVVPATPEPAELESTRSGLPAVHLPSLSDAAQLFVPPDIWSDDRPSLRKLWLYCRYGTWTRATGFARFAGTTYGLLSMAVHAALYFALWIVERPTRFAVAATVAVLLKLALF